MVRPAEATQAIRQLNLKWVETKAVFDTPKFKEMVTVLDKSLSEQEAALKDLNGCLKKYGISFPDGVAIKLTNYSVAITIEVPFTGKE